MTRFGIRITAAMSIMFLAGTVTFSGCSANGESPTPAPPASPAFGDYWYQGEAELTSYTLEQARYGEMHPGHAVLIFVTEDFWRDRQVKYESGPRNENVVSVLKLNATRKFNTGIYPYSIMSSIFTPAALNTPTLKVSTSSQEWCGHTFMQLNYQKNGYRGTLQSYFQNEGDATMNIAAQHLEDGVWTTLRINPGALPTGDIEMVPATHYLRLVHRTMQAEKARAGLSDIERRGADGEALRTYTVDYQSTPRKLVITFEAAFPHRIFGWEETLKQSPFNGKQQVTRATLNKRSKLAYWRRNGVADSTYRQQLGL